jgi:hypothetical protein
MNRQCSLYYLLALSLVLSVPSKVPGAEPAPATIDFSGASSTQTWGINARGEIVGFYVLSRSAKALQQIAEPKVR